MIADELREWIRSLYTPCSGTLKRDGERIADRIDAEYERVRAESIADMTDERMAEHGWVRLPKDADGEVIRIGDVMAYAYSNTFPMKVVALVPPSVFLTDEGPRYADMCRHYKPHTVEDVLREFALRAIRDSECGMGDLDETCAEYASKLRLAEEEGE